MTRTKPRIWPSDDQLRELDRDREFTDDGRKLTDSGRVGAPTPDADPDRPPQVR